MHIAEIEANKLKNEMKKFPLAKKMANAIEMNKLQQQVATLQTPQEKRTNKVAELQEEENKVTGIIQPIHDKLRQDLGSTVLTTS